jgi:hypothetical protein
LRARWTECACNDLEETLHKGHTIGIAKVERVGVMAHWDITFAQGVLQNLRIMEKHLWWSLSLRKDNH